MKTNNLTELVFILDRSGSMANLVTDTIGGYNSMLNNQRTEKGDAVITTVLFDDRYELLHDCEDIHKVKDLTSREYYARGMTALYDAVGKTIAQVQNRHEFSSSSPSKTIVFITTDGYENASREYSLKNVKKMIEHQKKKYGWEFIFLGANIDAVSTAEGFGIAADHAATYHADSVGTEINFRAFSRAASDVRNARPISAKWKEEVEEYHNSKH